MRKRNKQLIAHFLLLCLITTLLPFTSLHHHEEETHHCEITTELENDSCHISIYHSEYDENLCEHDHHFSKTSDDCDFCKYISSRRQLITFDDEQLVLVTPFLEASESQELSFVTSNANECILGRAPPVC